MRILLTKPHLKHMISFAIFNNLPTKIYQRCLDGIYVVALRG